MKYKVLELGKDVVLVGLRVEIFGIESQDTVNVMNDTVVGDRKGSVHRRVNFCFVDGD